MSPTWATGNAKNLPCFVCLCTEVNVSSLFLLHQTVSDIERGWILVNKDQHRQLKSLQEKGSKKEVSQGVSPVLPHAKPADTLKCLRSRINPETRENTTSGALCDAISLVFPLIWIFNYRNPAENSYILSPGIETKTHFCFFFSSSIWVKLWNIMATSSLIRASPTSPRRAARSSSAPATTSSTSTSSCPTNRLRRGASRSRAWGVGESRRL